MRRIIIPAVPKVKVGNFIRTKISFLVGVFVLLAAVLIPQSSQAAAGVNSTVNFQGKLVNSDGTNIPNGTYNLEFKVYQDGDGLAGGAAETLKWTETRLRNNSQGVQVTDGIFQVNLGSVNTALTSQVDFNQDTLWFSVNVGNTNATCIDMTVAQCNGDGEMYPLIRFTATPYALNSSKLSGLTSSQFVQLAQGVQADASTVPSVFINKTGASGNILQLQKAGSDVFTIDNAGTTITVGTSTGANFVSSGPLAIKSSGAGSDVIIDGSDQFIVQDTGIFNADVLFVLNESEKFSVDSTVTGATAVDVGALAVTNNTTSGIQNGLVVRNNAGSGTTESLLVIDNVDIDTAVTAGLTIQSAAGGITTGIDVSDADIGTGINLGTNDIIGTSAVIDFSSFDVASNGLITTANNIAVNGGSVTTTSVGVATLFNTNATTLNIGGATDTGGINLAGGSGSTGCSVDGSNGGLACSGNISSTGGSVSAATHTGLGAVTVSSGGTSALTLTSASGTAVLGGSTNTVQRAGSSLSLDVLNEAAASTFIVVNSSATQVANLQVEGGIDIGAGQTYKVNGTQISSANLSNDSNLAKLDATQTFTGNNTFGGTGNGIKLQVGGTYSDTSGTVTNTSIQPNFNPTATSTATFVGASISPTINFSNATPGAGNVTAFLVNPTWTAVPTGSLKLMDLQNGGTSVLNVSRTGIVTVNAPNTTNNAFLIQNQAGTALFNADTSSFKIRVGNGSPLLAASTTGGLFVTDSFEVLGLARIGNSTDNVTIDGTTKKVAYNGTARQTRKVTLSPEYLGAAMSGDGTNNIGTMSSDFCSGSARLNVNPSICGANDEHNYYSWTAQATNDYDIYVRYQLPSDFDGFASNSSIQMYGWRSTVAEKVELALFNASAAQCGSTTEITTSNTTWQQLALTGNETSDVNCNTTNMTPGSTVLFRVRMTVATNNNFARAGAISFDYLSKF